MKIELGKVRFPVPPAGSGIYQFRLRDGNGERVYIGEAIDLRRRFAMYRSPGPTQLTNRRINNLMRQMLSDGGRVEVDVITEAEISVGASHEALDLTRNPERLLVEQHLLDVARGAGESVENLT